MDHQWEHMNFDSEGGHSCSHCGARYPVDHHEPVEHEEDCPENADNRKAAGIPTAQEIEAARLAAGQKPARHLVLVRGKVEGRSFYEAIVGRGGLKPPEHRLCPAENIAETQNRDCGWTPVSCTLPEGHEGQHRYGRLGWSDGERPRPVQEPDGAA